MTADEQPQYVTHEVLAEAMKAAYLGNGPPVRITSAAGGAGGLHPGTAGFIEFGEAQSDADVVALLTYPLRAGKIAAAVKALEGLYGKGLIVDAGHPLARTYMVICRPTPATDHER
jgi:hypothetical protein